MLFWNCTRPDLVVWVNVTSVFGDGIRDFVFLSEIDGGNFGGGVDLGCIGAPEEGAGLGPGEYGAALGELTERRGSESRALFA